ncbi:MAG: YicC/YloC family endoribonuclease [Burkholderiales bacterium]|jgi:uncharacterized protein (TIGR00255 family)
MNSKVAGVHSMTGYGTVTRDHELGRLTLELRSVNSRFLDLAFRLPDELRALEPPLREAIQPRVARGKVDIRASVQHRAAQRPEVVLRPGSLDALAAAQDEVLKRFPSAAPMTVADCLRFPGVVDDPQPDPAQWVVAFRPLLSQAIDELVASRAREGARLADVIRDRARSMAAIVATLKPRAPELVAEFGQKLTERLREAATGATAGTPIPLDETLARIRQEVSVYGMRVDVAEELARLEIHVTELGRIVDGGGQVGKRLDFLMQELNREANTLGSKAAGLEVTQASVELKLLIEQVREQVQNLE